MALDRTHADPAKALQRTLAAAKRLGPGFMGELILETAPAMQRDAACAARLAEAADELRPEIAQIYADDQATEIASLGNGSKRKCQACKDGVCGPVSCWVVVIVIVIIIVTKYAGTATCAMKGRTP